MSQSRNNSLNWTSLGPDNYGSFTKAIIYDKNDATNQTIYIGTMGGGVFKSVNGGITWKSVSGNMMAISMTQTEDGTIYVATGDGRDVQKQTGLVDINYSTGFEGEGIYRSTDNGFERIEATSEWKFVNEVASYGNTVYAATTDGLFKSTDGTNWEMIVEGIAYGVKVNATGIVIANVKNEENTENIYTYNPESGEEAVIITDGESLPANADHKVIATSPNDPNYVYIAYLKKKAADDNNYSNTYESGEIYVTNNFTEENVSWKIAFDKTNMYDVFGNNSFVDNAMAVYPNNPKKVLLGGSNLWVMEDSNNSGIYRVVQISNGSGFQINNSGGAYSYNYTYIHTGIQNIAFNPENVNEFFVGSEGGVYKGKYTSNNGYTFEGMNRYMIDESNHTSVTRMFSVGFSGNTTVIGGSLDHGTIKVIGDPNFNNECTGNAILPNDQTNTDASATYGSFNYTMAGGPCAISTINPNAMFVTKTGDYNKSSSIKVPVLRTQSAGDDYDKENFTYSASNTDSPEYIYAPYNCFRIPFVFQENYNDTKAVDSVMFYADTVNDIKAGEDIIVYSLNSSYPFTYTLEEDLAAKDSIKVQDIISSTMIVPARESSSLSAKTHLYLTRDALKFNKKAEWWRFATLSSNPNAIALSQDGNLAFVGTIDGKLYKYGNLDEARDELTASGFEGVADKYIYKYDSVPDTSKEWDTIFTYLKDGKFSIENGDTVWVEYIYDTIFDIDTIWKYTDKKLDSTFVKGEDPIESLIVSTEVDPTTFNGQAITSISIDPQNSNNVLVTLGNYGNDNYVYYSTDGGETFSSIQGNLPKIPVYSSIIEKAGNGIILGTEKGIYSTTNNSDWTLNGLANIPVMDLKQQLQPNHEDRYKYMIDEVGDTIVTTYPGVYNEGAIFAATYGRGLYRCDNHLTLDNSDVNVEENTLTETLGISIYPNPIVNNATIKFDLDNSADVSYQIYDLSGRVVSSVSLGKYPQGSHNVNFSVNNLNAGTYIIKVQTGKTSETTKILVY